MGFNIYFGLLFLCTLLFGFTIGDDGKVHIVYMGSLLHNNREKLLRSHLHLLSSVLQSPRHIEKSLVCIYTSAFNGFATVLSKEQAIALAGIWPEEDSFSDKGMGFVPSWWKGVCIEGDSFNASNCNRKIFSYIKSTRKPIATITPSALMVFANDKLAPVVLSFSSRGPGALTQNILKPDISAPGLNIIVASDSPDADTFLSETISTGFYNASAAFDMTSVTSVAVPHVSGAAAFLKSMNPNWSSSAIISALMTTGTPFDFGAGVVNPIGALQPGLVYETSIDDYFHFLCNYGLDSKNIKLIVANQIYRCPSRAKVDLISNMNYPGIAISKLNIVNGSITVSRSITNISPNLAPTYKVTIGAPLSLSVKVSPEIPQFSETAKKLSFNVVFTATKVATKGYVFGTLVWSDGKHNFRTRFAVNMV